MSGLYGNSRTDSKLEIISSLASIFKDDDKLSKRCKFNFHYFTLQSAGQDFNTWNHTQLVDLLNKLKHYSEDSLEYWQKQPIGKGSGHILEVYGKFPDKKKTDFKEPLVVPIEAKWARFRLGSSVRLVGFVIPEKYHDKVHSETGMRFDKNTFYIVFLDNKHKFYKVENK